jgi:hypothetical protein
MQGSKRFFSNSYNQVKLWLWACSVFNLIITSIAACGGGIHIPRFQRLFRPLFLVAHFRNVQKVFLAMISAAPKIGKALLLLLIEILVFAVFAFVLLKNMSFGIQGIVDGRSLQRSTCYNTSSAPVVGCSSYYQLYQGQSCTDYFSTVHESFHKLFILVTTANFPDIMLPA